MVSMSCWKSWKELQTGKSKDYLYSWSLPISIIASWLCSSGGGELISAGQWEVNSRIYYCTVAVCLVPTMILLVCLPNLLPNHGGEDSSSVKIKI